MVADHDVRTVHVSRIPDHFGAGGVQSVVDPLWLGFDQHAPPAQMVREVHQVLGHRRREHHRESGGLPVDRSVSVGEFACRVVSHAADSAPADAGSGPGGACERARHRSIMASAAMPAHHIREAPLGSHVGAGDAAYTAAE